jgi:hypothetical protein
MTSMNGIMLSAEHLVAVVLGSDGHDLSPLAFLSGTWRRR